MKPFELKMWLFSLLVILIEFYQRPVAYAVACHQDETICLFFGNLIAGIFWRITKTKDDVT